MEQHQTANHRVLVTERQGHHVHPAAAQLQKLHVDFAVCRNGPKRRIVACAPWKTRCHRHQLAGGVINCYTRNLLAIVESVDETLELSIRVFLEKRLRRLCQAFRQYPGVVFQVGPQRTVSSRSAKSEADRSAAHA